MKTSLLHHLRTELTDNGQTIFLSVSITLALILISEPAVIFLLAIATIVAAYFYDAFQARRRGSRSYHHKNGHGGNLDPYADDYDEREAFGSNPYPGG